MCESELIKNFMRAVEEELNVSIFTAKKFGLKPYMGGIPGLSIRKLTKIQNLFFINDASLRFIRLLIGFAIVSLWYPIWGLRSIGMLFFSKKESVSTRIYFHRSSDLHMEYLPTNVSEKLVVLMPRDHKVPIGKWAKKIVSINNVSDYGIVGSSLFLSYWVALTIAKKKAFNLLPYLIFAPEWFFVLLTLTKLQINELWISNHYDRWALLSDGIGINNINIVQHGKLSQVDVLKDNNVKFEYEPIHKLRNINKIFCMDTESKDDFLKLVIASGCQPSFEYLNPNLKVTSWPIKRDGQLRLLVIGKPGVYKIICKVNKILFDEFGDDFRLAYRPSPHEKLNRDFFYFGDIKILAPDLSVPEVDIVVDYGSSLMSQIKNVLDVKTINWNRHWPNAAEVLAEKIAECKKIHLFNK